MENEAKLVAQKRETIGTSASRRLRREGWLPCIVNNTKGKSRLIQTSRHNFDLLLQHHMSESLILDIEIDGEKPKKVLLKEVQHHPVTSEILHADFVEISMTTKMRFHVLITLVGEAVGVTQEGGVLDHLLRELEVECLPTDLVEAIEADVSELKIDDTILVSDLNVDPRLTVLTDGDIAVAGVSPPTKEEEVVPEEAVEAAEGAEPEVIGEEKKEEEGEGEEEPASAKAEKDKSERAGGGKGKDSKGEKKSEK